MSFITELKRRNVFKVASVYLLTTWLILQIIAVISPTLNLPLMFGTVVTVVLFLGFPVACIIAWAFELTPTGMKFTKDVDTNASIRHETGQKLNSILMGTIVLLMGFIIYDKFFTFQLDEDEQIIIAVLPFQDMSPDNSQEYFGDGIAEEILNSLARLNKMRVISRTSSFKFKNTNADIREIGRLLNANYVLEGSVRKDKETFRITAQLIEVSTGVHLWSQTYDKKLNSIFAMQDELTFAITQALKLNLLQSDIAVEAGMTTNAEAYDLFLKGRALSYQRNIIDIKESQKLLEQAISLDKHFYMAKAQLFMTLYLGDHYRAYTYEEIKPKMNRLFNELVSINDDFALKSLVKAIYLGLMNNQLDLSEHLFKLAKQQAPSDSIVNNIALLHLGWFEPFDKILEYREEYLLINPLDEVNLLNCIYFNWALGKDQRALKYLDRLSKQSPEHSLTATARTVYLINRSPIEIAPYLANFKGVQNQDTQAILIESLIITGQLKLAVSELARLSISTSLLSDANLLVHLWLAILEVDNHSDLLADYQQLNIDAKTQEKVLILANYLLGNEIPKYSETYDSEVFTNKDLFISTMEADEHSDLFLFAIKEKMNGNTTYANWIADFSLTGRYYKKLCTEMRQHSQLCTAMLYLTTDMSVDELMSYARDSIKSKEYFIHSKYIKTSPLWLMLHEHPDFEAFANEHLNATFRKWNKSLSN
jgi:TolB-like protein